MTYSIWVEKEKVTVQLPKSNAIKRVGHVENLEL